MEKGQQHRLMMHHVGTLDRAERVRIIAEYITANPGKLAEHIADHWGDADAAGLRICGEIEAWALAEMFRQDEPNPPPTTEPKT